MDWSGTGATVICYGKHGKHEEAADRVVAGFSNRSNSMLAFLLSQFSGTRQQVIT